MNSWINCRLDLGFDFGCELLKRHLNAVIPVEKPLSDGLDPTLYSALSNHWANEYARHTPQQWNSEAGELYRYLTIGLSKHGYCSRWPFQRPYNSDPSFTPWGSGSRTVSLLLKCNSILSNTLVWEPSGPIRTGCAPTSSPNVLTSSKVPICFHIKTSLWPRFHHAYGRIGSPQ